MASSENQSLQIVLIVFVILTIILAISTFLIFRGWSDADTKASFEAASAQEAQNGLRSAQQDMQNLLTWMGAENIQSADEAFKADKEAALKTFGAELQNYSDGVDILTATIGDLSTRLAAEEDKNRRLTEQNEAREAIKQKQIDQFAEDAETAGQDLTAERTQFDQDRRKLEEERNELAQQRDDFQGQLAAAIEQRKKEMETAQNEANGLRARIDLLQSKIDKLSDEDFEVADGEIRSVNQRRRVVWVNLGSADLLHPQVTFSVYGHDATNVTRTTRKGAIEIIDIKDGHLALARIVDDSIFDPLLPGDKIYTPLWQPGRQDHFALAGWMDLDGDGVSDRRLVRDLVKLTGGVIDAELDDDGQESGKMTYNTRFLIVGEEHEAITEKLGQWQSRAKELGVRPMDVDKLLDLAGWRQGNRVLRYSRSGSGGSGASGSGANNAGAEGRPPFRPRPPVAAGGIRVR